MPDPFAASAVILDIGLAALRFIVAASIIWFVMRRVDLPARYGHAARLMAAFFVLSALIALAVDRVEPGAPILIGLKALALLVGVVSAFILVPLLPQLLRLPSPIKLQSANALLVAEIEARRLALDELRAIRAELEQRVEERARAAIETGRRLDLALRGRQVTVFNQDRDLRYTWISQGVLGREPQGYVGRTDRDVFSEQTASRLERFKRAVLDTGEVQSVEVMIPQADADGEDHWFALELEPVRDPDGSISGLTGIAVDISEQKRREHHVRLLMRELAHRSKNALAVVQAIARQTANHTETKDDFLRSFSARIDALAASGNLLLQEGSRGADLNGLIRSQLGHYAEQIGKQILLSGPHVPLPPDLVQNIGLAFHELATNAVKYGALSTTEGQVAVTWTARPAEGGASDIAIQWQESGGPAVTRPSRKGFGHTVIARTVARAVNGEVDLDYAPEGLRWSLRFRMAGQDAEGEAAAGKA